MGSQTLGVGGVLHNHLLQHQSEFHQAVDRSSLPPIIQLGVLAEGDLRYTRVRDYHQSLEHILLGVLLPSGSFVLGPFDCWGVPPLRTTVGLGGDTEYRERLHDTCASPSNDWTSSYSEEAKDWPLFGVCTWAFVSSFRPSKFF